jgi:hypothetical protein
MLYLGSLTVAGAGWTVWRLIPVVERLERLISS